MSQPSYVSNQGYIGENFFVVTFDVALDASNPPPINAFDIEINGTNRSVASIVVDSSAKTLAFTLQGYQLIAGDIVQVNYADPTGGNDINAIQGLDGADCASFSESIVISSGRPGPSAPPAPTLDSVSDSGVLGDGVTNLNTPTVSGTSAAGNTVKLYDTDGTTLLGSTVANGAGNWSITSSTLSDGGHTLKVTQTDAGSNTSILSTGLALTIDTTVSAPTTLAVAPGSDSGMKGDGISNAGTPAITGVAEANATVTLYDTDGTTALGSGKADGSGKWSITTSNLTEGSHTLTAKQVDVAGNGSVASAGFTYIHDTIGPTNMALSTTTVQQSGATNGSTVATISSTDLTAVTYGFQVGNGSIDADNGKFTISGNSLVAAQNLTAGSYHIYLSATDAAGNDAFNIFTVNVTNAPSVSSIVRAGAAGATVPNAATSVDYTVTFDHSVNGVDLSDFVLTSTGNASGTIQSVSGSGTTYSVTVGALTGDGTTRLDLKSSGTGIQDGSGNAISGGYTSGQTYTLDHTAPAAPSRPTMTAGTDTGASSSDAVTSNTTPVFTGTAEANATVHLYDSDGATVLGTATADGSGKWSITSSTLSEGSHTLTASAVDAAGNVSATSVSRTAVIDTTGPSAPATPGLSNISDSGTVGDGVTNVVTPVIKGTAEAGAKVRLYDTDGTTLLGTTTADLSGNWSITSSTLSSGPHSLTVKQTDLAGNVSGTSGALALTISTTLPAAPPTPALSKASDTGTLGDGVTYVPNPAVIGTALANAHITLYDTNGTTILGTAIADGSGKWSINSSTLSLGAHTLTATQTDVAGNVSQASGPLALTIEAAPPPSNPSVTTSVDGVLITQQTVNLPNGMSGTQTVIPVVTSARVEANGNASLADIPLVSGNDGNALLLAQLPTGFGLSASGGASQPAGTSKEQLIKSILAITPNNTSVDQAHLTGNGNTFLDKLSASTPLLVETVTPIAGSSTAPIGTLTLTGTSNADQHTALVIDATKLPAQSSLTLNSVDFAAIIGSANVTGTNNGQILTGDAASQHFTIGGNSSSQVFAGGGDDTLTISTASGINNAQASSTTMLLHGGSGNDGLVVEGASTNYIVENHAGYAIVTDKAQPAEQTLVVNVEKLTFSDTSFSFPTSDAQTVLAGLYKETLGRQADYKGFDYWANQQSNGASLGQIALDILSSNESKGVHSLALNGSAANDIEVLYQGIFGRHSDTGGLAYWTDAMSKGMALDQVAQNFTTSHEMEQHKVAALNWDFIV